MSPGSLRLRPCSAPPSEPERAWTCVRRRRTAGKELGEAASSKPAPEGWTMGGEGLDEGEGSTRGVLRHYAALTQARGRPQTPASASDRLDSHLHTPASAFNQYVMLVILSRKLSFEDRRGREREECTILRASHNKSLAVAGGVSPAPTHMIFLRKA